MWPGIPRRRTVNKTKGIARFGLCALRTLARAFPRRHRPGRKSRVLANAADCPPLPIARDRCTCSIGRPLPRSIGMSTCCHPTTRARASRGRSFTSGKFRGDRRAQWPSWRAPMVWSALGIPTGRFTLARSSRGRRRPYNCAAPIPRGAGLVRVLLHRHYPADPIPAERTLQRWFRRQLAADGRSSRQLWKSPVRTAPCGTVS